MISRISSWVNSPQSRFFSIRKLNVGLMKRRVGMFRLLVMSDVLRTPNQGRPAEKFASQCHSLKKSSQNPLARGANIEGNAAKIQQLAKNYLFSYFDLA